VGSKRDKLKRKVRKTVKWGGAGLTVLLVVVWIGSGWWNVVWRSNGNLVTVVNWGEVYFEWIENRPVLDLESPFFVSTHGFELSWWPYLRNRNPYWVASIPLCYPALLSLVATAAAWRADAKYMRRAPVGLCAGCGYDRAGLAAGAVCPECGAAAGE